MTQGQQSLSHFSSDVVWQTFTTFASLRKRLFNGHGRPWQMVMALQVDVEEFHCQPIVARRFSIEDCRKKFGFTLFSPVP